MSDQIFISHSKDDEELLNELDRVFGKVGLKQYRASFEDQTPPVSEELKEQINNSVGVFVVLGRKAQAKTHTMIWIGWEAGIAIESGLPVWILEDVKSDVKQPIPSFTDYILWDSRSTDQKRVLRDIIEEEFVRANNTTPTNYQEPDQKESRWMSPRNDASFRESEVSEKVQGIECPYEDCGQKFSIRFEGPSEFNCPSCRQAIVLENTPDYSW